MLAGWAAKPTALAMASTKNEMHFILFVIVRFVPHPLEKPSSEKGEKKKAISLRTTQTAVLF
jgi:hypothetical protein